MQKEQLRNVALLHPEEILQPYDLIIGLDGFDAIYCISEVLGGKNVYIPTARTIFAGCIAKEGMEILDKEGAGRSIYNRLARKYGYTERQMRRLLGGS